VDGLAGKIELRGEHPAPRRLDLHVEMARTARIETGHDGLQPIAALGVGALVAAIAALGVGALVAAIAKAFVVVPTVLVGVPEVEQRARHGPARRREDRACEDEPRGLPAR